MKQKAKVKMRTNRHQESDPSRFRDPSRNTSGELEYQKKMQQYIVESAGTEYEKFENFAKYISRQTLARFLALYEIFKLVLDVQGDVIECGVNWGNGLMGFALMSAVLEPINLQRRVIGFDTFSGFPKLSDKDIKTSAFHKEAHDGGLNVDSEEELMKCIELFDSNRFLGHINKVELVKGDAVKTIPSFIKKNPHTVISLLHLDFDIYEPTKRALESFLPRMPKGAAIVFDELNNRVWPGETLAVLDAAGICNFEIKRFSFEPHVSYAILK
jgi:hypothetical protein